METCVLIPQELALVVVPSGANIIYEQLVSVWSRKEIEKGTLFYPFQGTIRIDKLDTYSKISEDDIRNRYGLYDDITSINGRQKRKCNWIRFLKALKYFGPQVNLVCTKVKGEPIYEVIKSISINQELIVYYLPEQPEELFFLKMRSTLHRQTMDTILEDTPLDLSTPLLVPVTLPCSPPFSMDDEHGNSAQLSESPATSLATVTSTSTATFCEILDMSIKPTKIMPKTRAAKGERSLLPCEVCRKKFDRPSLLKRHMRTHTGEKPHVCMVCGKGFSTSSSLNTHRRIHSGEKPHECRLCGKRFTASSNLYYHRMTHIKEKPHKCSLCAKSFPTPGDLRSHMFVHNGSWPFKCHICSRGFSKQTNLKNHLFLHTGDKPHTCHKCDKKFALSCNLKAHLKTHEDLENGQEESESTGNWFSTIT